MKRIQYIAIAALTIGFMILQSCSNSDEPTGDSHPDNTTIDEGGIVGETDPVNLISREALYTENQVDAAAKSLNEYLGVLKITQYCMRGEREEQHPISYAHQHIYMLPNVYAWYGVVPHSDFAFASELISSYHASQDWITGPNGQFIDTRTSLAPLLNRKSCDFIPEMKAIVLLLYNYAAIKNVDMYGAIPYNDFKTNKVNSSFRYDDMRTIYAGAEANIDAITNCLHYFDSRPAWYQAKVRGIVNKFSEVAHN